MYLHGSKPATAWARAGGCWGCKFSDKRPFEQQLEKARLVVLGHLGRNKHDKVVFSSKKSSEDYWCVTAPLSSLRAVSGVSGSRPLKRHYAACRAMLDNDMPILRHALAGIIDGDNPILHHR